MAILDSADVGTVSKVVAAIAAGTILAANTSRKGATVYNRSTAILYLKCASTGAAVSATDQYTVEIAGGGYYELPLTGNGQPYTGIITGIWAAANGYCTVTEWT